MTQAQLDALVRMNKLAESHEILEKDLDQEKTQKTILHKGSNAEQATEGASADSNSSRPDIIVHSSSPDTGPKEFYRNSTNESPIPPRNSLPLSMK